MRVCQQVCVIETSLNSYAQRTQTRACYGSYSYDCGPHVFMCGVATCFEVIVLLMLAEMVRSRSECRSRRSNESLNYKERLMIVSAAIQSIIYTLHQAQQYF